LRKIKTKKVRFKDTSFQLSLGEDSMNMDSLVPKDGKYEPWLTKYLEVASIFYGSDKDAIDIGANVGMITAVLAHLQAKGIVIAFEALSVMHTHLVKNLNKNKLTNVIAEKKIVGEVDHQLKNINVPFGENVGSSFVSSEKVKNSTYTEKVETISLDTYFIENQQKLDIKILKIDVEGWETFVLRGASETLEKHQPVVFIELNVQERILTIEKRGKELFNEINSLFKYLFLIDRLSNLLIPIKNYSDLRGSMLTGHFVEDIICFNDSLFFDYIQSYCITNQYSCYHGTRTKETKAGTGIINSLSHFPDNWSYGHDFFLQVKGKSSVNLQLTFKNPGIYKTNTIVVFFNNHMEEIVLKRKPITRQYTFYKQKDTSIYVFTEKIFSASKHVNSDDPRTLGIQIIIEEVNGVEEEITDTSILDKNENLVNPISELIQKIQHLPAKVMVADSYFAPYHSYFNTFYTYCQLNGKFISLHCEINIQSFHDIRPPDFAIPHLYKSEYEVTPIGLKCVSKKHVGAGADPRIVSDGKNAYAYLVGYGKKGHPAFLYIEKNDSIHPLKAPKGFQWGKNWQPFLKNNRLYIVHELTPYSIYEINLNTYTLEQRHYVSEDYDLAAHHTNHTMFRGGGNAICDGDFVLGVGRASAQPYRHSPFLWSSYQNNAPIIQFISFFNQLTKKGFYIQDPTCFFKSGNNYYIGLACSETSWFDGQQFLNLLIVFDIDEKYPELPSFESVLSQFENYFNNGKINLGKHMFHCDRMQHDIPCKFEYGVMSTGTPGYLIYGPYVLIKESMQLSVELTYLTLQDTGVQAGEFDICLSKERRNGKVESIEIGKCDLETTNKDIRKAVLNFDTRKYIGYKVEFRVNVKKNIELNAFHIRTKKISDVKFFEKKTNSLKKMINNFICNK